LRRDLCRIIAQSPMSCQEACTHHRSCGVATSDGGEDWTPCGRNCASADKRLSGEKGKRNRGKFQSLNRSDFTLRLLMVATWRAKRAGAVRAPERSGAVPLLLLRVVRRDPAETTSRPSTGNSLELGSRSRTLPCDGRRRRILVQRFSSSRLARTHPNVKRHVGDGRRGRRWPRLA